MHALDLLLNRVSSPVLSEPGPSEEILQTMIKAALRVPDHGGLTPYRFLHVSGEARQELGNAFVAAAQRERSDLSAQEIEKLAKLPLRAPNLIITVACLKPHPKVPFWEQRITAGCAAHALILSAFALGIDAIWRTGELTHNECLKTALGLGESEEIIGFIYLGTAEKHRVVPPQDVTKYMQSWTGGS